MPDWVKDFLEFRVNPANDYETDAQWCFRAQVSDKELSKWKAENPEALEKLLTSRRSRYSDILIEIDSALLKKAKAGDARAIQLVWARFENWSPKIEEDAAKKMGGKTRTLAELIAEEEDEA